MNVVNFQFANNYTNLNLPGYMYNIRKVSISHSNLGDENDIIICKNFCIYFKLFIDISNFSIKTGIIFFLS